MARSSYETDDAKAEHRAVERLNDAEKLREQTLRQNELLIDSLPYGSLGIVGEVDPSTRSTWIYSDAEAPRNGDVPLDQFAKEFLGYDSTSQVGLTNTEKAILHRESQREVAKITPEAIAAQAKEDEAFSKAATSLWPEYAYLHPEMATDREGARAAMKYLVENSGLTKTQLAELANSEHRRDILDRIATTQYEMQWDSPRQGSQPSYDPEENRTMGISGGSNSGGHGGRAQEEQVESIMSGIADWQKRSGFTR